MSKINNYGACHLRACLFSLGRLIRKPFNTFSTVAVIGIALALPAALYVVLLNIQGVTSGWSQNTTEIALYLQKDLSSGQTQDLVRQLRADKQISNVKYISPEQGLEDFSKVIGADNVVTSLKTNPLPGVILVQPTPSASSPIALGQFLGSLQNLPEVSTAKLDMQWLQRFNSIVSLIQSGVLALGFLLGLGVLLIIGNTIRLATQNDRREIAVLKLVGATDAFIRRPFLYAGVWYGFFGGMVAWILINIVLWWLRGPASKVASAYGSDFYLSSLATNMGVHLLIISVLLGLLGAWVVVSKNLRTHI